MTVAEAMIRWEDINEDKYQAKKEKAAEFIRKAKEKANEALTAIYDAAEQVNGLPEEDRILSFEDDFERIENGLKALNNLLEYGR